MGLHIPSSLLLCLVDNVLDNFDSSVQDKLILTLLQNIDALLNQGILHSTLLPIQVLIELVMDLNQEVNSSRDYLWVLTLESYIPDDI